MVLRQSPFPESFLHTLPYSRPKNRAPRRHWTRTSSSSADLRFARGSPFLFVFRNVEKEFLYDYTIPREVLLKIADLFKTMLPTDVVSAIAVFKLIRAVIPVGQAEIVLCRRQTPIRLWSYALPHISKLPRARKLYPVCGWSIKSLIFQRTFAELFHSRLS
jgi:hypothetical protein